jgi:ADP-ribosylglycohydrolase
MPDPALSRTYGLALVDALAASAEFPGANDEQLPAITKLPPLVACHLDDPELAAVSESAIRVTNNAPRAVDFGQVCAELLRASLQGVPMESTLETAVAAESDATRDILRRALDCKSSVREMTKEFGLHCDLSAGVPSLMYNLQTASSFSEAIRRNIYAGGDNCGRAIVLGAVCGAQFGIGGADGIPDAWLRRVSGLDQLESLLEALFPLA